MMRKPGMITKIAATILLFSIAPLAASAQSRGKAKKPAPRADSSGPSVRPPAPEGTLASFGRGLPSPAARTSKVEIGDGISSPEMALVLAVGESTYFRCQDKVLQLVFGDPDAFTVIWSTKESNRSDFYLVPKRGGVSTNLRIEMESSTVTTRLASIAPKGGARPGDYNGEVIVRPAGYRDELAKLSKRAADLDQAKSALEQKLAEQEKESEKKLSAVTADLSDRTSVTAFTLLKALAGDDARRVKQPKLAETQAGGVRVSQASRAVRDNTNKWWLLIRVEAPAKGKKVAGGAVIERLATTDGRIVQSSAQMPKVINAGVVELLPLMVDTSTAAGDADNRGAVPTLTITLAGGKAITLRLNP